MTYYGEQRRQYQIKWLKARRDAWIEKQGGLCVKCGSDIDLEIDHIDRSTKEFQPTLLWSRREDIREKELAKCQVLCKICHHDKTMNDLYPILKHGVSRYNSGCRCDVCTAANTEKSRKRRSRRSIDFHE